jgi:acetyl esterase/lipase
MYRLPRLLSGGIVLLALCAIPAEPIGAQKRAPKLTVPDGVVLEPDVEYANPDGQHLQLDLARPKSGDGPFPAIVCIHGGGFRAGTRQSYDGLCLRLAERGYVAVTVTYRLAPKHQFPAAVHDVKAAVRWLRANAKKYKIDPERIGVIGGSAGGHLAQFLGVTADVKQFEGDQNPGPSSRVACVVNYYGPSDFTKSYGKSVDAAQVLPLWLGGNLEQARHKHIMASPLYWVTPAAAPTLCIHGTEDKYVAHEQAVWLIDRLTAADVEAQLLTLKGAGHGFKGKDAEAADKAMLAFFDKHLKKPKTGAWNLDQLRKPPKITVSEAAQGLTGLFYEGEAYRGKPTRVFAYLARPEKVEGKSPAMVLVHGGGGTAFKEWAELWAKRGYVALAMDLAGQGPDRKRLPDGGPPQDDGTKFGDEPIKEFWSFHAVANVIRGVSLLASRPEVDSERIGITGISWGGYLTCMVAGLDDRLKVAAPVYGCGFIHENSTWLATFEKMPDARRQLWVENFDPSRYVGQARMPMLFVNGTNDFAYPLDSYQKTYRQVKQRTLCVTVNMPHGHPQGWAPGEIGLFVDQCLKAGKPLARIESIRRDGGKVEIKVKAEVPLASASLHFTSDTGAWKQRRWQTQPARIDGTTITAELPTGRPLVYFLTLTDERKATVSTEHETLEK